MQGRDIRRLLSIYSYKSSMQNGNARLARSRINGGSKKVTKRVSIQPFILRLQNAAFPPHLVRDEIRLILVDLRLPTKQVALPRRDDLRPHHQLVAKVHRGEDAYADVIHDEVPPVERPGRRGVDEGREAVEERDHAGERERDHGPPSPEWGHVCQGRVGDVLRFARAHEVDVGDQDCDPHQDAEDGDEGDEVAEDLENAESLADEGNEAEGAGETERVYWDPSVVGPGEESGRVAFDGERIEGSGGDVKV